MIGIEKELKDQESLLFALNGMSAIVAGVGLLIMNAGHIVPGFVLIAAVAIYNAVKRPGIMAELEYRQKMVLWRDMIDNVYVFSLSPLGDSSVSKTFEDALKWLEKSGNPHKVTVHKILFRDVIVFSSWIENGKRVDNRAWRDKGAASETWEQYIAYCEEFRRNCDENRLRKLRGNEAANQWTDEYFFRQSMN